MWEQQDGEECQQHAALEDRQGETLANESTDRLDVGNHQRDDFALARAPEGGQREAKDLRVEDVPQPTQHALAGNALEQIDDVFEALLHQDESKETKAQGQQIAGMVQCYPAKPEQVDRKADILAFDALVNDRFGQDRKSGGSGKMVSVRG